MDRLHPLLKRQLKLFLRSDQNLARSWGVLLNVVNASYHQFDDDREMLERSLDLNSKELLDANEQLRHFAQAGGAVFLKADEDGSPALEPAAPAGRLPDA